MGIEFKFFKAGHGDSILVSTYEMIKENDKIKKKYKTHILIDGGEEGTYADEIEDKLENIDKLDLLVLTHIDSDHIGGIIEMFEEDEDNFEKVDNIWFNDSSIKIAVKNGQIGYGQGNNLEKLVKNTSITHNKNVFFNKGCSKEEREYFLGSDIKLTLLSPMKEILEKQVEKWNKKTKYRGGSGLTGKSCIDNRDIVEVVKSFQKETLNKLETETLAVATNTSLANSTSIAFILEYNQKQFLFLGDADIKTINQSLIDLGFSSENRIKVGFVKLSHHGSKKNINKEFLDLVDTSKFIILTDCSKYAHPDKETLSLIATYDRLNRQTVELIFNYQKLIRDKLSEDEEKKHNFKAYSFLENLYEVG